MANELTVTKEHTARFVHDALEMETAVFTLGRAIEDCESKKKQVLEEAQKKVDEAKAQVDRAESIYQQAQNEKRWLELEEEHIFPLGFPSSDSFGSFVVLLGIAALIALFIGILQSTTDFFYNPEGSIIAFLVAGGLIAFILFISYCCGLIDKDNHKAEIFKQTQIISKCFDDLKAPQSAHALTLTEYSQAQLAAEALDAQIATLKENREAIRNTLTDFYALNVIKPKYRNIECAIIMNELYENDRVDTMREAMDKCEERIYRNTVIAMGQNIQSMLGKMTVALVEISDKLDSINSNVKIMSQDLYTFSERIAQGQKEQLRESQLTRYAAEQTAASASYLEWHQRNQNY